MKLVQTMLIACALFSINYASNPQATQNQEQKSSVFDKFTRALPNFNKVSITPKDILNTTAAFYKDFEGGDELLKKAEGYLVFPEIYDAGFVVGGKYGYGALVRNDSIAYYYKIYSTSVGLKAGIQKFSLLVVFLTKEALERFLNKEEWKVGLDSKLTFTSWHEGIDINSLDLKKDTLVIPFNQVGIMANLSFEGTVFQKLN